MPLPFTRKQLVVPLWLSLAVLAGCATVPHPDATAPQTASAPASRPRARKKPLPNVELTDQLVMRFLVGDIALQRGEPTLAAQTWNDLAKRTHDPRIARRATEVSIGAGQLNLALDSAQLWIDASPQALNPQQVMLSLLLRANRLEEAKPHLKKTARSQTARRAVFHDANAFAVGQKTPIAQQRPALLKKSPSLI